MLSGRPADLDDDALAAHMTTLNDAQLSDLIAAVDAAEVISKAKTIDMGASALWYATKLGWPVFPLKPRGKTPLTTHGLKDASRDPAVVADWWKRWPDANIGVPTGPVDQGGCGYDVVDVDGVDGIRAWAQIKHAACDPGCCDTAFCPAPGPFDIRAEAFTPGDPDSPDPVKRRAPGRHLFVPATGVGNAVRLGDVPIDRRAKGGYICAPPSIGPNGVRYAWLTRPAMPTPTATEVAA